MQEPSTGIFFPGSLPQNPRLKLVTIGLRKRLIFNVYAFGIYTDPNDIKHLLGKYKETNPDDLLNERPFFDVFFEDTWDKGLVLVMARKIKGELLSEVFHASLLERISRIGLTVSQTDNKEETTPLVALENFKSQFNDRKIPKSTKITFEWQKGGVLVTSMDSDEVGRIVSPTFCIALFDIFLGENAIYSKSRKSLVTNVLKILNGKQTDEDVLIEDLDQKISKRQKIKEKIKSKL